MGFDKHRFTTEDIPDICICLVCQQVLEEPMRCPDSHSFCFGCITEHISERGQCPVNRRKISNLDLLPLPLKTYESLAKLQLRCAFKENGCTEEVSLSDIIKHQSECRFKAAVATSSLNNDTEDVEILKQRITNLKSEMWLEKAKSATLASKVDGLELDLATQRRASGADKKLIETLRSTIEELNRMMKYKDQRLIRLEAQLRAENNARSSRSRGSVALALKSNDQDCQVIKTSSDTFGEIQAMLRRQKPPPRDASSSSESSNGAVSIADEPYYDSDTEIESIEGEEPREVEHHDSNMDQESNMDQSDADLPDTFVSIQSKKFKCPRFKCLYSNDDQALLEYHVKAHHRPLKNWVCEMDGCRRRFKKQSQYDMHIIFHSGQKPYACEFDGCEERFSKFVELNDHVTKDHEAVFYRCDQCDFVARQGQWRKLKIHQATKHSTAEGRPFKCPYEGCGKSFSSQMYLEQHDHCHTGEKPYDCECGVKFQQKASLSNHRARCPLLKPKKSRGSKRLRVRKPAAKSPAEAVAPIPISKVPGNKLPAVHRGRPPAMKTTANPIVCPIEGCDMEFTAKPSLERHVRRHTGEKPFTCHCGESFARRDQWIDHERKNH